MLKIRNFSVLLLFILSSCLSIRNFESYQKVPLSESEFLPTKTELEGEVKKVVVFPFDTGDNKVAKNANVNKVAITAIENILTENKLIKLIDRNSAKKLEKEIRLSEMKKSGIYKGPQIADYAIMGTLSNVGFTSKYKAAMPGYKPGEGYYVSPAHFEYKSDVAGNIKVYELPLMSVVENIAFEGGAIRKENAKNEGVSILGIIDIKGKRDAGIKRDDNLVRQAAKKSINYISRKLKNAFAKKGYVLEKRVFKKKVIFKISLGHKDGLRKGDKFDIIGKFEENNDITRESEIESRILAGGKVSDRVNDRSSWILINKDGYDKIRLGDAVKIKY
tara:strand:- start:2378 stop:3376 length:999 start_codon:yes stop_codon:yes gene_type:complete